MLRFFKLQIFFLLLAGVSGCGSLFSSFYDDTPSETTSFDDVKTSSGQKKNVVFKEESNWREVSLSEVKIEEDYENASKCCSSYKAKGYNEFQESLVNVDGLKYCPERRRCSDEGVLPPQPCLQPMPEYYHNISLHKSADGVVLIHPYTRTEIICYDDYRQSAEQCVKRFKSAGYVLITDLPQLPAKYDFLRDGTYPTRKWRGGGEVVPRW